MPIYEYRCGACGYEMELLQKITEEPLRECPACGQEQLRKLISVAAFRLKGGGWYETDFKNGNKRNLVASSDGKDKPKEDAGKAKDKAGGTATTESKPASSSAAAAG
jgi:putative FmdB family regulatory protein